MKTDWMWNDDGQVWGLSLDPEQRSVEWADSLGCACSSGFAEQSFADFLDHGPRYGRPPQQIVDDIRASLLELSTKS